MRTNRLERIVTAGMLFTTILFSVGLREPASAANDQRLSEVWEFSVDGEHLSSTAYTYDDQDRLVQERVEYSDATIRREYHYDSENRPVVCLQFINWEGEEELVSTTDYEYGDTGLLIRKTTRNKNQIVVAYEEYYSDGSPKVRIGKDENYGIFECHYDPYGHIAEPSPYYFVNSFREPGMAELVYALDDMQRSDVKRTYDEDGRVTAVKYSILDDCGDQLDLQFFMDYDAQGRIAHTVFESKDSYRVLLTQWTYQYLQDGTCTCTYTRSQDSEQMSEAVMQFDAEGRMTRVSQEDYYGEEICEYSDAGDLISFVWIQGGGSVLEVKYNYEYQDGVLRSIQGPGENITIFDENGKLLSSPLKKMKYLYESGSVSANGDETAHYGLEGFPGLPYEVYWDWY